MRKLFCIALVVVFGSCNEPEVGDVWRYRPGKSENPFRTKSTLPPYMDYKVIEVQKGWVKFMDLSDSSMGSSTIRFFKVGSEKLSPCK